MADQFQATHVQELLSTLQRVHRQGFVHRDVRPSNVLRRLNDDGVLLIDWNCAASIGEPVMFGGTLQFASDAAVAACEKKVPYRPTAGSVTQKE